MSLRFVGSQLLRTGPSSLLIGASKASASFWVQVNAGNDVVAANGVEVFGDSGGKFSATLSGTGSLRLQWSSNDGQSNATSACTLALMPGTSYHVAASWQVGTQQYYLNGVQVGADIKGGTLGVLGDSTLHPYRLGSDQAGADVTLDQPTLWVGYALTPQDVVALRDRTAQPSGVAPSSITLEWSLGGADSAPAQVGDAGLADASTSGLNLSSIVGTAPTYQAADLDYVARPTVGLANSSASGRSIILFAQDGTGVNTGVTSIASSDEIQSLQFAEPPSGDAFTLTFGGESTAPIPVTVSPPSAYGLWTIPVVEGHSYDLASTFLGNYYAVAEFGFETIQGGVVVARTVLGGGQGVPSDPPLPGFNDAGIHWPDGTPVPWMTIATGIVATGSTLQIRVTGSLPNGYFDIDALRADDTTAGTLTYYDDASPYLQCFPTGNGNSQSNQDEGFDGTYTVFGQISGIGPIVTVTGGATAIQSALEAVPAIGSGNVLVADLSNGGGGNYRITFVGSLANAPRALIVSPDPNVLVAQVNAGGLAPTLSIGGGSPIPLYNWVWTETSPLPYALCPLPQSAPASQTFIVQQLPCLLEGGWNGSVEDPTSLSGAPIYGFSAGASMTFPLPELPPATYEVAVTYPHAPFSSGGTTCQPSTATQFLVLDAFGNTLATYSVDQSQPPADYQDSTGRGWKVLGSFATTPSQTGLTLVINTVGQSAVATGSVQPVAILDAMQLVRTSADTSVVLAPGSTATLSIPGGWMTTTLGAVPATSGLPVAPPSPNVILPTFVNGPKTLKPGYNVEQAIYGSTFPTHSNLAYMMPAGWSGVRDANGYPTKLIASRDGNNDVVLPVSNNNLIITPNSSLSFGDPRIGTAVINPGLFVMTWDGDESVEMYSGYQGTAVTEVSNSLTGTTGNRRVYNVQIDPTLAAGPSLSLRIQTTTPDPSDSTGNLYLIHLSNLTIYPPDPSDPTGQTIWENPPLFHPWFLYKLQGMRSLRYLDPLNINNNPCSGLSDYKPATHSDRCSPTFAGQTVGIATIGPATNPYFVLERSLVEVLITTTVPHGLFDGCIVNFSGCGTVQTPGGELPLDLTFAAVHVVNETTLSCVCGGGYGSEMTNTLSGGTLVVPNHGTAWPIEDVVALVAASGATDLWFNTPITIDTSPGGGAYQVAAKLATTLPAGIKVHVEPGNECWNFGFFTYFWCKLQNARITGVSDGKYDHFYVNQAKAIHDQFLAAFTAAGRASDLVRVVGLFTAGPNTTTEIAGYFQQLGGSFEEACVAVYTSGWPAVGYDTDQLPIFNAMTTDQLLDYAELNAVYGGEPDDYVAAHARALTAAGFPAVKMTAYEGAAPASVPVDPPGVQPPANTPNYALRMNATKRHPRMYAILLQYAQAFQDVGLTLWNYFNVGGGTSFSTWEAYERGDQQRGTGDMVADAINVTNPQAKNQVLSELGGAWHYWSTLVTPATTTTTTTTTKKITPGRNGPIRANGFPRGTFRTVRPR
jgi:hypothetical protein